VININDDGILLENIDANKIDVQVIDARSNSARRHADQRNTGTKEGNSTYQLWKQHKQLGKL